MTKLRVQQVLDHFYNAFSNQNFSSTDEAFEKAFDECKTYIQQLKNDSEALLIQQTAEKADHYAGFVKLGTGVISQHNLAKYKLLLFGFDKLLNKLDLSLIAQIKSSATIAQIKSSATVFVIGIIALGIHKFNVENSQNT